MSNFEFGAPLKAGEGSSSDSLSSAPVLVEAVQPHVQPVLTTPPPLPHRSTSHTSTSAGSVPVIAPSEPSTVLAERLAAVKNDDPVIAARQVEKVRAAEREIKGRPVGGTIVKGIEDDRLYAMLRRFDVVSPLIYLNRTLADIIKGYNTRFTPCIKITTCRT